MKKTRKMRSSLVREHQKVADLLESSGYNRLKAKHGKNKKLVRGFLVWGDNGEHEEKYPSGNCFAPTKGKKELPPDAKQFPVGNSHKQGLELIYSKAFASQMNGKKT